MSALPSPRSVSAPLPLSRQAAAAPEQPISRLMADALDNPKLISLAAGFVDERSLPRKLVQRYAGRLLDDPHSGGQALQYGLAAGDRQLRQAIAARYFADRWPQRTDAMILTTGSNQLLHLISECLLEPDDIVLCAAPTYFVYLAVLRDLGVRAVSVESDEHGVCPEALERTLDDLSARGLRDRVKMLYLVPYFDNPAGVTMPEHRRRAIIAALGEQAELAPPIALLADNAYRDLRYDGADVPCFVDLGAEPDWTIETGTFSKNLSPGLRVGWGVLPEPLHTAVLRRKSVIDFGSPHFSQCVVRDIVADGQLDEHLQNDLLPTYRSKRDAMIDACQRYLSRFDGVHFQQPGGGLYVWLQVPEPLGTAAGSTLWETCVRHGVLYVPGGFCFASEGAPVQNNTMRLSFGVQPEPRIAEGIELLGQAIEEALRRV
ncbi:aminotransferase-like domain-containing protein [Roseimaritima sediminicola]|uniref:aminotransferase-like domain-containing protein n=1 Tax=Roseimaritima sediminicola TaxID=2662066 RepID=UPI0012983621|nr:PLP-dependent aminotransferase family protein [Roseimaritima sediminicola]